MIVVAFMTLDYLIPFARKKERKARDQQQIVVDADGLQKVAFIVNRFLSINWPISIKNPVHNKTLFTATFIILDCGDCYGAATTEVPCCRTCEDVKRAYTIKGWTFKPEGITQCQHN